MIKTEEAKVVIELRWSWERENYRISGCRIICIWTKHKTSKIAKHAPHTTRYILHPKPCTRRRIGYLLSLWCWVVSAKLQFLIKAVTKTELDTDFLRLFWAWVFFAFLGMSYNLNNCNKYDWGFVLIAHNPHISSILLEYALRRLW